MIGRGLNLVSSINNSTHGVGCSIQEAAVYAAVLCCAGCSVGTPHKAEAAKERCSQFLENLEFPKTFEFQWARGCSKAWGLGGCCGRILYSYGWPGAMYGEMDPSFVFSPRGTAAYLLSELIEQCCVANRQTQAKRTVVGMLIWSKKCKQTDKKIYVGRNNIPTP